MGIKSISIAIIALVLSASTNAALIERLGGLAFYDNESGLTWLADANYAQTSGYDTDGLMTWTEANTWAENLSIGGVDGWRLADTLQPDPSCSAQGSGTSGGFNCTGSEMGNLFYSVLGGTAGQAITTNHNANYDLFSNMQNENYWTATQFEFRATDAWRFYMGDGSQKSNHYGLNHNAWAVYSGDVSAVPVPAAVWLFGSGLIGLIGAARRKKV